MVGRIGFSFPGLGGRTRPPASPWRSWGEEQAGWSDGPCYLKTCDNQKTVTAHFSFYGVEGGVPWRYTRRGAIGENWWEEEGRFGGITSMREDNDLWVFTGDWSDNRGAAGQPAPTGVRFVSDLLTAQGLNNWQEDNGKLTDPCNFIYKWNCSKITTLNDLLPAFPTGTCCPHPSTLSTGQWDEVTPLYCKSCWPKFTYVPGEIRRASIATVPMPIEHAFTGALTFHPTRTVTLVKYDVSLQCIGTYQSVEYGKSPGPGPESCEEERTEGMLNLNTSSIFPNYAEAGSGGLIGIGDIGTTTKLKVHPPPMQECTLTPFVYYIGSNPEGTWYPPGTGDADPSVTENNIIDGRQAFDLYETCVKELIPRRGSGGGYNITLPGWTADPAVNDITHLASQNAHCWNLRTDKLMTKIKPFFSPNIHDYLVGCLKLPDSEGYATPTCCPDSFSPLDPEGNP